MAAAPFANRLCEILGIRHPILLAGMAGGYTTPELVAAVSEAGGLGAFGLSGMTAEAAADAVEQSRRLTSAPIAINVLLAPPTPPDRRGRDPQSALEPLRRELGLPVAPPPPPPPATPRALVSAGLAAGASVVSVGLGDPGDVHDLARAAGAPVVAMASSVDDAVRSVQSGADVIVAQGSEAGGHRVLLRPPRGRRGSARGHVRPRPAGGARGGRAGRRGGRRHGRSRPRRRAGARRPGGADGHALPGRRRERGARAGTGVACASRTTSTP